MDCMESYEKYFNGLWIGEDGDVYRVSIKAGSVLREIKIDAPLWKTTKTLSTTVVIDLVNGEVGPNCYGWRHRIVSLMPEEGRTAILMDYSTSKEDSIYFMYTQV